MTPLGVVALAAGVVALALMCFAVGAVLGGAFVHLRHLARPVRQPGPAPGPMTEVDEAQGLGSLADLVAVGEHLGPAWIRTYVDGWTDPGLLKLNLHAALYTIVISPEVVRRVRSIADEQLVAKSWHLPVAERPERES